MYGINIITVNETYTAFTRITMHSSMVCLAVLLLKLHGSHKCVLCFVAGMEKFFKEYEHTPPHFLKP